MRARLAWIPTCIVVLLARGARAEEAPRLAYVVDDRTQGCPDENAFREAVTARLGRDPFDAGAARTLVVRADLEGGTIEVSATLVATDDSSVGLRSFVAPADRCAEAMDAVALAVSLAVQPGLGMEPEAPPPASRPTPTAVEKAIEIAKVSEPTAEMQPQGRERRDAQPPHEERSGGERSDFALGLVGHVAIGIGPGVGGGGAMFVQHRDGALSVGAEFRVDGLSSGLALPGGGSVSTSLVAGTFVPCGNFDMFAVCGVALVGEMRASSKDVTHPASDREHYAAAGGRFVANWPLSQRFYAVGRLDLLATLVPVDIELGGENVWSSPAGSATLGAGVAGTMP